MLRNFSQLSADTDSFSDTSDSESESSNSSSSLYSKKQKSSQNVIDLSPKNEPSQVDLNIEDCSNNAFTPCVVKLVNIRDELNGSDPNQYTLRENF